MNTIGWTERDYSNYLENRNSKIIRSAAKKSRDDLCLFFNTVFALSIKLIEGKFIRGDHFDEWTQRLQDHKNTVTISARLHAKSTVAYAFLAWLLNKVDELPGMYPEVLYVSYNDLLASEHTRNLKRAILANPAFKDCVDLNPTSESIVKFAYRGKVFTVKPAGIFSFKRGKHTIGVICDDILKDPRLKKMSLSEIMLISDTFFQQIGSIPKEGGFLHVLGTPQDEDDLLYRLKQYDIYDWKEYPAIIDFKKKRVLWKELFPFEKLIRIRDREIGTKAFNKEYQCKPARSEEMYFKQEEIEGIIGSRLKGIDPLRYTTRNRVIGGLDIGKKLHPSHLTLFEKDPVSKKWKQILSKYMEHWDYTKQIGFCKTIIKRLGIEKLKFDNTRGEFDLYIEEEKLPKEMIPVTMSGANQYGYATAFDRAVSRKAIELLPDLRQKREILKVDTDLDAPSDADGHGDAFWSNALALSTVEAEFTEEDKPAETQTMKKLNEGMTKRESANADYL